MRSTLPCSSFSLSSLSISCFLFSACFFCPHSFTFLLIFFPLCFICFHHVFPCFFCFLFLHSSLPSFSFYLQPYLPLFGCPIWQIFAANFLLSWLPSFTPIFSHFWHLCSYFLGTYFQLFPLSFHPYFLFFLASFLHFCCSHLSLLIGCPISSFFAMNFSLCWLPYFFIIFQRLLALFAATF